ncbi:MAG TPA: FG-GAP repeat protein, partial [Thermoanaerobaculia bacterium]
MSGADKGGRRGGASGKGRVLARTTLLGMTALLLTLPACRRKEEARPPAPALRPTATPPSLRFEEKAEAMGIHFTHVNGARGDKWMPETMGGGVAVLDYDGDGKPDLLFVSSCYWPGDERGKPMTSSLALFRNEGVGSDGLP